MSPTIIAAATGFFILFSPLLAQPQEELNFGKETSAELSYDFGQAKEGDRISHIFEILNNSQFPWWIKNIVTSCHCVLAKLIDEGKEIDNNIAPGEVLRVEVEIDTTDHKGDLEQFVYVNIIQANELKILKLIVEVEVREE